MLVVLINFRRHIGPQLDCRTSRVLCIFAKNIALPRFRRARWLARVIDVELGMDGSTIACFTRLDIHKRGNAETFIGPLVFCPIVSVAVVLPASLSLGFGDGLGMLDTDYVKVKARRNVGACVDHGYKGSESLRRFGIINLVTHNLPKTT